jgi:hypothetical protein
MRNNAAFSPGFRLSVARTVLQPSLIVVALRRADGSNGFINGENGPNHHDPERTKQSKLDVRRDKVNHHGCANHEHDMVDPILAAAAGDAAFDDIEDGQQASDDGPRNHRVPVHYHDDAIDDTIDAIELNQKAKTAPDAATAGVASIRKNTMHSSSFTSFHGMPLGFQQPFLRKETMITENQS